jgi:Arc/MetJ-type ribon-helix-helix transcriptional regulator
MYLQVDTLVVVSPLKPTNFRLESELLEGLQEVRARDGISVSEQVRRAIQSWLRETGIITKSERKRAVTRRRP